MAIHKEIIDGTKIINEVDSSNIVKAEYDTITKKMIVEFKTGALYEYIDVPHSEYTKFRMAPSQGSFFAKEIAKKYRYKKV